MARKSTSARSAARVERRYRDALRGLPRRRSRGARQRRRPVVRRHAVAVERDPREAGPGVGVGDRRGHREPSRTRVHGVEHGERVAAGGEVPVEAGDARPARRAARAAAPGRRAARRPSPRPARRRARRWSTARPRACRPPGTPPTTSSAVVGRAGLRGVRRRRPAAGCGRTRRARCTRPAGRASPGTPAGGHRSSASQASERSRQASYGCGRPVAPGARRAGAGGSGRRSTGCSARSGNSLTPVIGVRRVATVCSRCARTAADPVGDEPGVQCGQRRRRRASISWKNAHAAAASSAVSDSTYQEPPAGSITRATCASSTSSAWVLRAIRRENGSDAPIAASKGDTVTASAPPTPAAKPASVPRSRFTYGSRRVEHGRRADGVLELRRRRSPHDLRDPGPQPPGRPHLRDRRELLGRGGVAELQQPGRRSRVQPGGRECAQVGQSGSEGEAELLRVGGTGCVHRDGVDDDGPDLRGLRGNAPGQRHDRVDVRPLARAGPQPDRIQSERAEQVGRTELALGGQREEGLRGLRRTAGRRRAPRARRRAARRRARRAGRRPPCPRRRPRARSR